MPRYASAPGETCASAEGPAPGAVATTAGQSSVKEGEDQAELTAAQAEGEVVLARIQEQLLAALEAEEAADDGVAAGSSGHVSDGIGASTQVENADGGNAWRELLASARRFQ